jgi:hypothetical protein
METPFRGQSKNAQNAPPTLVFKLRKIYHCHPEPSFIG